MCVNNSQKQNKIRTMSRDVPTQKIGYLEVKQSSKVRGRKLKAWKRRWVVLTMMSNLSSEQYVAKLDVYDNEAKWRNNASDKTTFVLEHVTSIQQASSKTHQHAFEIVEKHPVLVLSGSSELESFIWMFTFQQMLTPDQIEAKKGTYIVSVVQNEHADKWNLAGILTLSVTPMNITLSDENDRCVISWGLSTLMKFNIERHKDTGVANVLVIECGPNAPTGQSCFRFNTLEAQEILGAIRQSICFALARKQTAKRTVRSRTLSATLSEKNFEKLLDAHVVFSDFTRDRSGSDSSGSTLFPGSPSTPVPESGPGTSLIPLRPPRSSDSVSMVSRGSPDLEALHEAEEHGISDGSRNIEDEGEAKSSLIGRDRARVSFREPALDSDKSVKHGYSVIKDVLNSNLLGGKASTEGPNPAHDIHYDRARSHSAVEAGLEAKVDIDWMKSKRSVSFEVEDDADLDKKSDRDSAISSTTNLSELSRRELPQLPLFPLTLTGRRRSSSTPDLHTYGKYRGSENVYEELDELRASIQRLNKLKENETPPALPARPFSMSFSAHSDKTDETENAKKKRLLFGNKGRAMSQPTKSGTEYVAKCTCDEIRVERLRSISDNGQCFACGGDTSHLDHRHRCSNENIVGSSNSSINDLYMSIPDLITTTKRRRSSDINPMTSSFLLDSNDEITHEAKYSSLPGQGRGKRPSSLPGPKHVVQESLINLSDPVDMRSHQPVTKPLNSSTNDPLISFFLDDAKFESNPMVTGQLASAASPPPNNDLLTLDGFSNSFNQPATPLTSGNILPGQNGTNIVRSAAGGGHIMPTPFAPFQTQQYPVLFHNTNTNGVANLFAPPMVNANAFNQNPFFPNPHNFQMNFHQATHSQEDNYLAMTRKAGAAEQDTIFTNSAARQKMDTNFFDPRYIVSKTDHQDVYVSPSGIPK